MTVGYCGKNKPSPKSPLPKLFFVGHDAGGGAYTGTNQAVSSGFRVAPQVRHYFHERKFLYRIQGKSKSYYSLKARGYSQFKGKSKFLTDKILTTRSSVEGERKVVTVLFADVANYTSLSEKPDPEEIPGAWMGASRS